MITISRRLEFDAGHRVLGHESKCANLHGHRYVAEVEVTAHELDGIGRIIDFSVVKEQVGGWIDTYFDHNMILHPDDPLLKWPDAHALSQEEEEIDHWNLILFGPKMPYIMKNGNPTAENMAVELFQVCERLLIPKGVMPVSVVIYETPNCWARYAL